MAGKIPKFTAKGLLPEGVHVCSAQDFISRFCAPGTNRGDFKKAIVDVLDFAAHKNARFVFVGGSFVTSKPDPNDLDVVIALRKKEHVPEKNERLLISGKRTDIMFCSEDEPKILSAFVHLLSTGRHDERPGVVQIAVEDSQDAWIIQHPPDEETYEVVKRAYFNREIIDLSEPQGILVTIHGLMSHADWNAHVVPIASSQGWIVAPYVYGYTTPEILVSTGKRKTAVDDFRNWIYDVQDTYGAGGSKISVIAHSFGTYLIGAYMAGFDEVPPVTFNSLILTGSILNENYDWVSCAGAKVARVRNEIAPNDQWVKWMPKAPGKWTGLDPLFGRAGVSGFSSPASILDQPSNSIFDHNNMIRRDVISGMWMPYLNSNRHASDEEFRRYLLQSL